jgi:hypothetical protein
MQNNDSGGYPYFQYLEDCNEFGGRGVETWLFYPGMTFGSRDKWWPDTGNRPTAHEGLDICYYTDRSGRDLQFDPGVQIPVMTAGTVIAVCDDFLGCSVFLEHHTGHPDQLISVYAHIVPCRTVLPGNVVSEGEVIGTVADTIGRKNKMPAHLHITIMKIPSCLSGEHLDWNFICNSGRVTLFDPLQIMACTSCRILPKTEG